MYKLIYTAVFLLAALGASAQNMPERSEVRRGNRQYNKGNYEKSIERYERALEAAPESFEATYNLGNALYKAERFDKAEQTMRKAAADSLRADGERAEAFYNLGNAQFKQQKYKEALESYKQSLRLNPADQQAKYNYAYTKRLIDDNEDGGGGGGAGPGAAGESFSAAALPHPHFQVVFLQNLHGLQIEPGGPGDFGGGLGQRKMLYVRAEQHPMGIADRKPGQGFPLPPHPGPGKGRGPPHHHGDSLLGAVPQNA